MNLVRIMLKTCAILHFTLIYCAKFQSRIKNEECKAIRKLNLSFLNDERQRGLRCVCHYSGEELKFLRGYNLDTIKNEFNRIFKLYKKEIEGKPVSNLYIVQASHILNDNKSDSCNNKEKLVDMSLYSCELLVVESNFGCMFSPHNNKKSTSMPLYESKRSRDECSKPQGLYIPQKLSENNETALDLTFKRQDNSQTSEFSHSRAEDNEIPLDLSLQQQINTTIHENLYFGTEDDVPLDLTQKSKRNEHVIEARSEVNEQNQEDDIPLSKKIRKQRQLNKEYFECLQNETKTSINEDEALKMIEKKIKEFLQYTSLNEINIDKILEMFKFLDNYELKKDEELDIFYYINEISNANDKFLQVIAHGLISFLIQIKNNELKLKKNSKLKLLGFMYMMKTLSILIKKIEIGGCSDTLSCNYINFKPKYIFILNLIHEVFLEVIQLSEGYGLHAILYKLLILAELRFKYALIKHNSFYFTYKSWLNISFNPIFNVFFFLDKNTIHTLISKVDILIAENVFLDLQYHIKEYAFFLGIFNEIFNLQQKHDLMKNYKEVLNFLRNGYPKGFIMHECYLKTFECLFLDLEKVLQEENCEHKTYVFKLRTKRRYEYRVFYMFLNCSKAIDLYKILHGFHYDYTLFKSLHRQLGLLATD